jgi:glycosyltransferase involved in cell wall biosynthesis
MNILIASFSFPSMKHSIYEGRFVFSEAMAYGQNGASVTVITPHFPGVDKGEQVTEKIRVFRFQYFIPKSLQVLKKPGVPIYDQKSLLAVFQIPILCFCFALDILKHARWADIIHAQWTIAALLALPAKWIFGKKIILTARGSDIRLLPKSINRFIHRQVDATIDCFPQPWSNKYKQDFPAHYMTLPLIVHNDDSGIMPEDMHTIFEEKSDPFIIMYVGRFDYMKIEINKLPLIDVIRASRTLKLEKMDFHVFYIGDGEEDLKSEMLRTIKDMDLQEYISLLGPKTNVLDYIHFCHLGIGGIAFNAVSQEFTISGKPQILIDGKDNMGAPWRHDLNAILIEPGNQTDLEQKLLWAMNNRGRLETIGENARDEMSKYIVNSELGGMLYLKEFQKVIERE